MGKEELVWTAIYILHRKQNQKNPTHYFRLKVHGQIALVASNHIKQFLVLLQLSIGAHWTKKEWLRLLIS